MPIIKGVKLKLFKDRTKFSVVATDTDKFSKSFLGTALGQEVFRLKEKYKDIGEVEDDYGLGMDEYYFKPDRQRNWFDT